MNRKANHPSLAKSGPWFVSGVLAMLMACATQPPPMERYDQFFEIEGSWSASHILVSYKGASRAQPHIDRDREEAREKAIQLQARLLEEPGLFDDLARSESDGPAAQAAGYLGAWEEGAMAEAFQQALEALDVGALTRNPVESAFGFHIIRREPTRLRHYACDAFVIAYKGSPSVPAVITRTKEEARAIAEKVAQEIKPENFADSASKYNDLARGVMPLAVIHEKKPLPFDMAGTLEPLAFGEVAGPVEMPIGYAFMRRTLVEQFAGAQILLSYKGANGAKPDVARTREEARAEATRILEILKAEPQRFAEMASAHSDGPNGDRGGYLGVWFRGKMVKAFDNALGALSPGDIAPQPVETPYGFHLIMRKPIPGG